MKRMGKVDKVEEYGSDEEDGQGWVFGIFLSSGHNVVKHGKSAKDIFGLLLDIYCYLERKTQRLAA